MTATVFLVRHAAHALQDKVMVGRLPGVGLGPDAPPQLERLSRRMAGERLDAVFAGPLERAQATAQAVAAPFDLEVQTDRALDEIDFGSWSGKQPSELDGDPRWRTWCTDKSVARAPGGESLIEVQARMLDAVERVWRDGNERRVAMVSHGDPIKTVLAYFLGASLDHIDRFDLGTASVSALAAGSWGARILFVNERPA